jgi:hypothetical protein
MYKLILPVVGKEAKKRGHWRTLNARGFQRRASFAITSAAASPVAGGALHCFSRSAQSWRAVASLASAASP